MRPRITIAGDIGSGKTTVSRLVAARLGVEPLSTGAIQRQLAAERGIDTLELNRRAETDPTIDKAIDDFLRALQAGPLVVESRMAWHFVPDTLKVYLYVVPEVAAARIHEASRADETYASPSVALDKIRSRRASERARYQKYYGVEIDDLANYDLVVDTTMVSAGTIADTIAATEVVRAAPVAHLSPRDIVPLGHAAGGGDLALVYADHVFHAVFGLDQLARALADEAPLIEGRVIGGDDRPFRDGESARAFTRRAVSAKAVRAWEARHGFRFAHDFWRR